MNGVYKLTKIIPQKLFFRLVELALAVISVKLIAGVLLG